MQILRHVERGFAFKNPAFALWRILAFLLLFWVASLAQAAETNGFVVRFTAGDGQTSDVLVLPNLSLYTGRNEAPTSFLPPGKYTAEFRGFIHAELRGTYHFKAERLKGKFTLQINGTNVYSAASDGGEGPISGAAQLNKGANPVRAVFTSTEGESFLRVGWTERGTNVNPISDTLISHSPNEPGLRDAAELHWGRELFIEHRCVRCHSDSPATLPAIALDAPSFDGIGARLNAQWMAEWIANPKALRGSAQMPRTFHGEKTGEQSEAIAAYLASLTDASIPDRTKVSRASSAAIAEVEQRSGPNAKPTLTGEGTEPSDHSEGPKPLFHRLHCTGCHVAPEEKSADPAKISLKHVASKFKPEQLAEFLKAPELHFTWTRMPNFKLADVEANELATYLLKHAEGLAPKTITAPSKPVIERGRKLVQSSGCLNCHSAKNVTNEFTAPALAKLGADGGCLAPKREEKSVAPQYGFDAAQISALKAFLKGGRGSMKRESPMEYASRQAALLQCNACHGKIELVPPLELLGGKLKPEWAAEFLAGSPSKVRADIHPRGGDWVRARMPAFRSRAKLLAEGMAAQHGFGPKTDEEPPIDEAAAAIGHKMIGKENGLSCISCHAVNEAPALEVFESEGTNLGFAADRLLKSYFFRWMRNPLTIDPQSKMPAFFNEEGQSALTDYYEGDAEKQILALYEYMRMGGKMQKPGTGGQ